MRHAAPLDHLNLGHASLRDRPEALGLDVDLNELPADHRTYTTVRAMGTQLVSTASTSSCRPCESRRTGCPDRSSTTGTGESIVSRSRLASTEIRPWGEGTLPRAQDRGPNRGATRTA